MKRNYYGRKENLEKHIGHVITYYSGGEKKGKVLRLNYREDINAFEVWIDNKPFPVQIFDDQIRDCECRLQQKEWTPDGDYH